MKASIVADFLLFIGGIILLLIVLGTVFGKGIAYNMLGFAAEAEPTHLQEELRAFVAAAAYAPGNVEFGIKTTDIHEINLSTRDGYDYVQVRPISGAFRRPAPIPLAVGECSVVPNGVRTDIEGVFMVKNTDCEISEEVGGP